MVVSIALILAAGEQTRWEMDRYPFHKQLLDVGGETIIGRIARQCLERNVEPVIVTYSPMIKKSVTPLLTWLVPERRRWTVETLLSTHVLWLERTIVLLGDVIYSRAVMDRIFTPHDQELKVFGNEYEIYALTINDWGNHHEHITDALTRAIRHAESGASGGGKLRKFYQIYCGLDPDSDEMESKVLDLVCHKQDYTQDVDTRRDYITLQNKVVKAGLLDDLHKEKSG